MKIKLPFLLLFVLLPLGCIQEIYINTPDTETSGYVIFALLDQEDNHIQVQLSPFSPLYKPLAFNLQNKPNPRITLYQENPSGTRSLVTSSFRWIPENSNKYNGFVYEAPVGFLNARNAYWIEVSYPNGTQIRSEKQYFPTKVPIKKASYSKDDRLYRIQFADPKNQTNYYSINAEINYTNPNDADGNRHATSLNNSLFDVTDDTVINGNENAELSVEIYNSSNTNEKVIDGTLTSLSKTGFIFFNKLNEIYWQSYDFEGNYGPDTDPFFHLFNVPLSDLKSNLYNQSNERVFGTFLLTQTAQAPPIYFR